MTLSTTACGLNAPSTSYTVPSPTNLTFTARAHITCRKVATHPRHCAAARAANKDDTAYGSPPEDSGDPALQEGLVKIIKVQIEQEAVKGTAETQRERLIEAAEKVNVVSKCVLNDKK